MNLISTSFLFLRKELCTFLNIMFLNITIHLHLARKMEVRAGVQKQSKMVQGACDLRAGYVLNQNVRNIN